MTFSSLSRLVRAESAKSRDKQIEKLRLQLLLQKRWSYHRYIHLREGLVSAEGVRNVLVVGAGRALAELMLAIEFPEIQFHLTDVRSARTPNFKAAKRCARAWGLKNVDFGVLDVTEPIEGRYDLVASVEVLEHIEDDELALSHMVAAADKYVFCLVPFADENALRDPRLEARAWRRNEHYRYGYSPERLRRLLPDIAVIRGCYWKDRGFVLREEMSSLDDETIRTRAVELASRAVDDISDEIPETIDDAQGIWVLARTSDLDSTRLEQTGMSTRHEPGPTRGRLDQVRRRLVFFRSWNYFRYLHLRRGLLGTSDVRSVLSVGGGRGLAELALALEFPQVRFHLTEVDAASLSSTRQTAELAEIWEVDNLTFGLQDVLEPIPDRYDLVCAVEVLAHVEDDARAAGHLRAAADRYVFCLVPFADSTAQADPARQARAWETNRQYRVGYTEQDLRALFPGESVVRGCYWRDRGAIVQARLASLDERSLPTQTSEIWQAAESDLVDRIPRRHREALGISILARSRER